MRRRIRTPIVSGALALLLVGSACGESPEPDIKLDGSVRYGKQTIMGRAQRRGVIRIGVPADIRPFSTRGAPAHPLRGLSIDLAGLVADALGVRAKLVTGSDADLLRKIRKGALDVAFPLTPITEELYRAYAVADPYFVGHQRMLVRKRSPIRRLEDLRGRRVCTAIEDHTGLAPSKLNGRAKPRGAGTPAACFRALSASRVDAVLASDADLLQFLFGRNKVRMAGERVTTVAYGPVTRLGALQMQDLLDEVVARARENGGLRRLYKRWMPPEVDSGMPRLTAREAAALYPVELMTAPDEKKRPPEGKGNDGKRKQRRGKGDDKGRKRDGKRDKKKDPRRSRGSRND